MIKSIAVIAAQGTEIYFVGKEIDGAMIERISLDHIRLTGDPFDHYCGYDGNGRLLFTINPHTQCVVEYLKI